jgi:hypothetical protein
MEQQLDRLREQLRAESVRAGLPALVTLPTGMTSSSMVPSSLPSQAAGVGAPSTVDQRLLENELVARKAVGGQAPPFFCGMEKVSTNPLHELCLPENLGDTLQPS